MTSWNAPLLQPPNALPIRSDPDPFAIYRIKDMYLIESHNDIAQLH
jgi:hypothetical protein